MVSTINSPTFSDIVVVYRQGDFHNDALYRDTLAELGDEETRYHKQFEVFRAMHEARDYRLVFSVDQAGGESVRELERALTVERAKGGLPLQVAMHHTLQAY